MNINFAGIFAASLEAAVRERLAIPHRIVCAGEADLIPHLQETDVLVSLVFTGAMASAARRLKLLQVPGAGLDRIDRAALPPGAWLANAYGHETGIAEYAIGAMLSLMREFGRLDEALRRGEWQSQWAPAVPPPPTWPELAGKTLGILGYGRIGQAIARRARAFDMEVLGIRRDPTLSANDPHAQVGGMGMRDEVLRRADYLVVAMPAGPDTVRSIGRAQFALMKPTAYLVNVARAEIIDEDALYDALSSRRIAGAALDVWYRYPTQPGAQAPAHRPFHALPNVLMTPHIAGWTDGMMQARARLIADNIRRVASGEEPLNAVARG